MTATDEKRYTIGVSQGTTVRVSLAFLKNNTISSSHESGNVDETSLPNLDLMILAPGNNSTPIAKSVTTNNNVEIVEFTPSTTGIYTIVVKNTSKSSMVTYGVSWMEVS